MDHADNKCDKNDEDDNIHSKKFEEKQNEKHISNVTDDNTSNTNNLDAHVKVILSRLHDTGPTFSRQLYEQRKKEVEELTKRLEDEAAKAMLKLLETNALFAADQTKNDGLNHCKINPRGSSLGGIFRAEIAMKQMEDQVKLTSMGQAMIREKLAVLERNISRHNGLKSNGDESLPNQAETSQSSEALNPRFQSVKNSIKSGSSIKRKLPDFTRMPLNDREAFLCKSGLSPMTVDANFGVESRINGKPYFFHRRSAHGESNSTSGVDLDQIAPLESQRPCSEERVALVNALKSSDETFLRSYDEDDIPHVSAEESQFPTKENSQTDHVP